MNTISFCGNTTKHIPQRSTITRQSDEHQRGMAALKWTQTVRRDTTQKPEIIEAARQDEMYYVTKLVNLALGKKG